MCADIFALTGAERGRHIRHALTRADTKIWYPHKILLPAQGVSTCHQSISARCQHTPCAGACWHSVSTSARVCSHLCRKCRQNPPCPGLAKLCAPSAFLMRPTRLSCAQCAAYALLLRPMRLSCASCASCAAYAPYAPWLRPSGRRVCTPSCPLMRTVSCGFR
jgi:hypothetical protein